MVAIGRRYPSEKLGALTEDSIKQMDKWENCLLDSNYAISQKGLAYINLS